MAYGNLNPVDDTPPFNPSYFNAVDQIYHCEWAFKKLRRLELLRRSVDALWPDGHPTNLIQVAGTAGKGSTSSYLEIGLSKLAKSGAYISPELFDYRERYIVGGLPVEQQEITDAWESIVRPHCVAMAVKSEHDIHYSHEVNLLLALTIFQKREVQWGVIETAIGGRYDQSSALEAKAKVLTNVGNDHEGQLGAELWQRALDKVGIAKRDIPFFTAESESETLQLLEHVCKDVGAPFRRVCDFDVESVAELLKKECGIIPTDSMLQSDHQIRNLTLAIKVLTSLFPDFDASTMLADCVELRLLGRGTVFGDDVYVDVAHNSDKMKAMVRELEYRHPNRGKVFVVGVPCDRDPKKILEPILPIAKFIIATASNKGGLDADAVNAAIDTLACEIDSIVVRSPAQALAAAKERKDQSDLIVITGDMHVINEALNPDPYLRLIQETLGWRYGKKSSG